jgi:hypothetical protein
VSVALDTVNRAGGDGSSFYGRPAWEFWLQKRQAEQAMEGRDGFLGVVVDRYDSLSRILAPMAGQGQLVKETSSTTFGMWLWHEKWTRSETAQDRVLAFCEQYGITLLPVQFHLKHGSSGRGRPKLRYAKMLRRLVIKAGEKGIRVEALDGAPQMALAENRPSVLAILDVILAFNKSLAPHATLSGIHLDIEPYLLPGWKTEQRQEIMRQNLELFEAVALKLRLDGPGLTFSASVPFWYDEKTAADDSCLVEFDGQTKNFHEHIQDLTDYIALMSYRRVALGRDSIAEKIEAERAYAEWIGKYVCAGMETLKVEGEPEVSFHGLAPSEFWFQKQKLDQVLGSRGGFGGVIVHSYGTFAPYLESGQKPAN